MKKRKSLTGIRRFSSFSFPMDFEVAACRPCYPSILLAMTDSRFDTSSWATEDVDDKAPGPSRRRAASDAGSASSSQSSSSQTDEEEDDLEEGNDLPTVKPLTADELEDLQRKQKKRGIIYISRIPPGMTPPKVRHLLSGFGEVERIYLQDGKKKEREARGEISRKCE